MLKTLLVNLQLNIPSNTLYVICAFCAFIYNTCNYIQSVNRAPPRVHKFNFFFLTTCLRFLINNKMFTYNL